MVVSAVNSINTKNRSCVIPAAQGALIGAATGMALKYAYPLNAEEKSTKEYTSVINDINAKKTTFSPWTKSMIDEINSKQEKSIAEDVFVKTYEGLKYGDQVGVAQLKRTVEKSKDLNPAHRAELKVLFQNAKRQAENVAKKHIEIYNLATKHIRPTGFFLTAGAVTGAVVAIAREILRTEVK